MDFTLTSDQDELGALTRQILAGHSTTARDTAGQDTAAQNTRGRDSWADLAKAGVLAAALPESVGGDGLGLLEQCSVLIEIGRAVSQVPYLPSIVLGASVLARFGSTGQQRLAEQAGRGDIVIAAALDDDTAADPVTAREVADGWQLTGAKSAVPAGTVAEMLLVSAGTPGGSALFLVEPGDVTVLPEQVTGGNDTALVDLGGVVVPADRVVGSIEAGPQAADWLLARATIGFCALQLGVTERALDLTAAYARTREQFGKPIGSFQAVSQRLADGYIDVEAIRLTLWQAAWRLAEGLPAETEVATAKFWAAEGGHRVAHTAVHVHGGVGIDMDGDVHRYYAAAKFNEFALGGATAQLRRIGAVLAAG
jgi:3-oxocholest-4-en-26-oyl-CoA dehydrogenase beta subunit